MGSFIDGGEAFAMVGSGTQEPCNAALFGGVGLLSAAAISNRSVQPHRRFCH